MIYLKFQFAAFLFFTFVNNVTPETTGEAEERQAETGKDDKILEVLAGLAEQVVQLRNAIDGKADDTIDGEDVEQW